VDTFEFDFHYHLQILLKQPDFIETQNQLQAYTLYNIGLVSHFVLLASSLANQQYFSLTPNQYQPPTTSQPALTANQHHSQHSLLSPPVSHQLRTQNCVALA
jgi:hypothetical protein